VKTFIEEERLALLQLSESIDNYNSTVQPPRRFSEQLADDAIAILRDACVDTLLQISTGQIDGTTLMVLAHACLSAYAAGRCQLAKAKPTAFATVAGILKRAGLN
jgi:hypothetical protein